MRAVGIILAGGYNRNMRELTLKRATAAMPVAGSYRAIDFALSSMSNSHIQKVAVITQDNLMSLNEHLNSSKWWDFGRKQGGLFVMAPYRIADNGDWYRGTADSMYQNINFLKNSHEPYVIIASGDGIYKLDYDKVLEYHISKKSDLTVVCKKMDVMNEYDRYGYVQYDEDGRITDFIEKPSEAVEGDVSCGIYVLRRRHLIDLLEECAARGKTDFVRDILIRHKSDRNMYAYSMDSYWSNIGTVDAYFRTNMDFLKPEVREFFFREYPDIHTKVDDNPPAKYNPGASMKNSLAASGCIINGSVENSVLFKKVYVGSNCVIKNSIILNDVYIGDNSVIENCIVESHGTINANSKYYSDINDIKVIVEKNERYNKWK
ncbi:MAG: glucose-1-phosphate adenylyltransferase subunit GlgD [Lachnospiraceae bacterium]|nr:glucose-1-phosphate adenylyltransferase subunit GlgD [Lachnospiraceae bacterium]